MHDNNSGSAVSFTGGPDAEYHDEQCFSVASSSGTVVVAGADNSLTTTTGRTVEVHHLTGGSVTFNGAITGGGTGVYLHDNSAGSTVSFTGGLTLNTTTNNAFSVASSSGTVEVSGTNNNLTTTSGTAFSVASSPGTVVVTGANNNLTTTTGTALSVQNSNIGAGGLTFRTINVNGAPVGIDLLNTGQGGLTVSGTGAAGSGGTIQNTGNDGVRLNNAKNITLNSMNITNAAQSTIGSGCGAENAADCSAAVDLNNTSNVSLNGLSLTGSKQMGISGYLVNGLTINSTTVTNAGDSNDEYALLLHNPFGTVSIKNSTFTGMYETGIRLYKNNSDLLYLTLDTVTLTNNNLGEDGFQFKLTGQAKANMLVKNSNFKQLQRDGIDGIYQDDAKLHLTAEGNTFENNGYGGITISGNSPTENTAKGNLTLNNNSIKNTVSTAIVLTSAGYSQLDAVVTNNTIQHPPLPAVHNGEGIHLSQEENSVMTVQLENNTISGVQLSGISANARLAATNTNSSLHIKATTNTVSMPKYSPANGMSFKVQTAGHTLCLDASGNTATGNNTTNSAYGIYLYNTSGHLPASRCCCWFAHQDRR